MSSSNETFSVEGTTAEPAPHFRWRWQFFSLGTILILLGVLCAFFPFPAAQWSWWGWGVLGLSSLLTALELWRRSRKTASGGAAENSGTLRRHRPAMSPTVLRLLVPGLLVLGVLALLLPWVFRAAWPYWVVAGVLLNLLVVLPALALWRGWHKSAVSSSRHQGHRPLARRWIWTATALVPLLLGGALLPWRDLSFLAAGPLLALTLLGSGIALLVRGMAGHGPGLRRPWPSARGFARVTGITVCTALALAMMGVTAGSWLMNRPSEAALSLAGDDFYRTGDQLPQRPGVLLRTAPYSGNVPEGLNAQRILYTTTDESGGIITDAAVLAAPASAKATALIVWGHGTVGAARACAPSLGPDAVSPAGIPRSDEFAARGWAVVTPDYPGMGTEGNYPYLLGKGEAHSLLDAARAARSMPDLHVDPPTVIAGHSQGGHAALWASGEASSYAPELQISATVALSPASDPGGLARRILAHQNRPAASTIASYVVVPYMNYYPELGTDSGVPAASRFLLEQQASRCLLSPATLANVIAGRVASINSELIDPSSLDGPFGSAMEENKAPTAIASPLFVGQGSADEVIPIEMTREYVASLRARGLDPVWHEQAEGTHMGVVGPGSELTRQAFAFVEQHLR